MHSAQIVMVSDFVLLPHPYPRVVDVVCIFEIRLPRWVAKRELLAMSKAAAESIPLA